MNKNKSKTNVQIAVRVSAVTIIGNILLTTFQVIAGIVGNSAAMIADAMHGLSDGLSTIVVIVAVKLAAKKEDKDHHYGHERFECVAAIVLSVFLLATGAGIGYAGVQRIINGGFAQAEASALPGVIALVGAVTGIAVKEAMYWYTRAAGKKINSGVLMADAWHHRSDALTSIGSFLGILGARMFGIVALDSIAAIITCLFILKVALDIFRNAAGKMTDKACDEETEAKIREVILAQEKVVRVDELKTRLFGDKAYVEVEIAVDGDSVLRDAHAVAHVVHDAIEREFESVKHCAVHVNPV
jgi:cation diffusion facilitator family transporter